jgi:hypothetical protein
MNYLTSMTPMRARKVLKPNVPKWFCDVRELVVRADVLNCDLPLLDALANEMESHLNVLAPIMKDRVLAQLDRVLAVHKDGCWLGVFLVQIF